MGTVVQFKRKKEDFNVDDYILRNKCNGSNVYFSKDDLILELNFVIEQLKDTFKDISINYELYNDSKFTFVFNMISIGGVPFVADFIFDLYLFNTITNIQQLHEQLFPALEHLICSKWCSLIYKEEE